MRAQASLPLRAHMSKPNIDYLEVCRAFCCAYIGAVCHCGRTVLQLAQLRARSDHSAQGAASVCCCGHAHGRASLGLGINRGFSKLAY